MDYTFDQSIKHGGKDDIQWFPHRHRHIADSFIDAIAKTGIF